MAMIAIFPVSIAVIVEVPLAPVVSFVDLS